MKKYKNRTIEKVIINSVNDFPVVILTGARQTGKSTLLKHLFPNYKYVTLDYPNIRSIAKNDPEMFLDNYGDVIIIDEIQYAPELLEYIKIKVDEDRSKNGKYILTGSQYFPLMAGVSESLAGRASIHSLLGFSLQELDSVSEQLNVKAVFDLIFKGFYPDSAIHNVKITSFYASYLQTYLERDIRNLLAVQNLSLFNSFLELLAARVGSVLNLNEIAGSCGISFSTAKKWLSLLESTQIVYLLRPFFKNITKRVIKSPKLYFYDTGLLAYLLRYQSSETLQYGPLSGSVFENFIVLELLKKKINYQINAELYYYRDSNKNEIDIIIESNGTYQLVEVKMAKTIKRKFTKTLEKMNNVIPGSSLYLVSFDTKNIPVSREVSSLFWYDFIYEKSFQL
jgi:uncharacterized protein